ncbi:MAG: ketoacyl-ACP synthase III [Oscillospiraceae bacterium]|nr:ketoacyl-ACP synthase III [Oscillospiraceae bacterium]
MSFNVLGSGSYVPPKIVTNEELSRQMDTSDEWIASRTGIRQRHICTTETASDLAIEAAKRALESANTDPKELDLILCATVSGEVICPSLTCLVQAGIGATCPAMDINAACSAFLYMLATANGFFCAGMEKILVVGTEQMSRVLDWTDRSTAVLFGDGAGALVLGKGENFLGYYLHAQGDKDILYIPTQNYNSPWCQRENEKPAVSMKGQGTFRYAVNAMVRDIRQLLEEKGIREEELDWVIPHQANRRIIDAAARRFPNIPNERFYCNIDRYGNTSSASIPMALDELARSGQLKRGDLVALAAFGGGLSDGAVLLRW